MKEKCLFRDWLHRDSARPTSTELNKVFPGWVDPQAHWEMKLSGARTAGPLHLTSRKDAGKYMRSRCCKCVSKQSVSRELGSDGMTKIENNITMAWCHYPQKISTGKVQQTVNMVNTNRKQVKTLQSGYENASRSNRKHLSRAQIQLLFWQGFTNCRVHACFHCFYIIILVKSCLSFKVAFKGLKQAATKSNPLQTAPPIFKVMSFQKAPSFNVWRTTRKAHIQKNKQYKIVKNI